MAKKSNRGGSGRGQGRHPINAERMELKKFHLRKTNAAGISDFEFLQAIGGSAAAGIRMLIDEAIESDNQEDVRLGVTKPNKA